uniref:PPM-type phosphatase domain-containing protein n=1 Tax=Quercus lobata TaxID=97700 RepID=A0A7N2L6T5_QUELO
MVWDVISNEEAVQIVSSTPDTAKSAKHLVECAAHAWKRKRQGIAMDDISAICLFFHSSLQVHPVNTQETKCKCHVDSSLHFNLGENMIIGRFLALDKEETCIPAIVSGGLVVEKVLIDEVLAINESIP